MDKSKCGSFKKTEAVIGPKQKLPKKCDLTKYSKNFRSKCYINQKTPGSITSAMVLIEANLPAAGFQIAIHLVFTGHTES